MSLFLLLLLLAAASPLVERTESRGGDGRERPVLFGRTRVRVRLGRRAATTVLSLETHTRKNTSARLSYTEKMVVVVIFGGRGRGEGGGGGRLGVVGTGWEVVGTGWEVFPLLDHVVVLLVHFLQHVEFVALIALFLTRRPRVRVRRHVRCCWRVRHHVTLMTQHVTLTQHVRRMLMELQWGHRRGGGGSGGDEHR